MNYFPKIIPDNASRRAFLKRSTALSVAASATPWALSLAAMSEAAAASATDYKALVCVFLYGGNDYANTLVPYDLASYNLQQTFRSNLAIDRNTLTPLLLNPAVALLNGRQYALAPGLDPLLPIFNAGKMSVVLNVARSFSRRARHNTPPDRYPCRPNCFRTTTSNLTGSLHRLRVRRPAGAGASAICLLRATAMPRLPVLVPPAMRCFCQARALCNTKSPPVVRFP